MLALSAVVRAFVKRRASFPEYPKTPYFKQGSSGWAPGDVVLDESVADDVLSDLTLVAEEKLDGANCRVMYDGVEPPLVGNREHVLKKGYVKKETPAKLQFRPLWNWVHDNWRSFRELAAMLGETPVVYGEWLHAQHTVRYDALPSKFAALDLFMSDGTFMDRMQSRQLLNDAGFTLPPLLGRPRTLAELDALANAQSDWGHEPREGVYMKTGDGRVLTGRYKYVRKGFSPRKDFNETGLLLNSLASRRT